jgi:hypothetical protein
MDNNGPSKSARRTAAVKVIQTIIEILVRFYKNEVGNLLKNRLRWQCLLARFAVL